MADRAGSLVADFVQRARILGAVRIVAAATAALRGAENGNAVAHQLEQHSGVPVRILSGDDEARLVYQAVLAGLGAMARRSPCVVFDIGGGSTEVVSGLGEVPGRWVSLPFGAVSLTERFLASNPPTEQELDHLDAYVSETMMQHCASMPDQTPLLAGVGGTVTVLAMTDRKMSSYEPGILEGWRISRERLEDLIDRLCRSTEEARRRWPAMGDGRADIVIAGARVVRLLMRRFPSEALVCSTQGLRYGLARLAAQEAAADARQPFAPANIPVDPSDTRADTEPGE
jgi:exopolyphosphatase/guanosine-5'-triphosphate,3'-diphosphate pyrophosphatase